ncbi:MAG: beta-propeller domain-containing protein [Clostridia bacterium]|nr:beta-propeller domain-containing protein [Clostridia bacterium]
MKKTDKDNLNFIKSTLQPVNEKVNLPAEIAENATVALVAGKEQSGKKAGRKRLVRRLSAAVATLIVLVGVGAFVSNYNAPAVKQIPSVIADAEFAISGNDEQVFVDYFTALKAEYKKNNRFYYGVINNFGEKLEAAEDMLIVDEAPQSGIGTLNAGTTGTDSAIADHADFGATNTQYFDVDEDDIIKNDGKYIYVLSDWSIKIVEAETMKLVSKTDVYYNSTSGAEGMYLWGETLVIIGTDWDEEPKARIILYDISDRKKPVKTDEFSQDGNYFSSRLVDGKVILISQYTVYPEEIEIFGGYAKYEDIAPKTETNSKAATLSSQMISILPQDDSNSDTYVVMSTVDLAKPDFEPKTSAILGNGREVYCTANYLYIIAERYDRQESSGGFVSFSTSSVKTAVHRFTFKSGVIEPDGTGEVEGRILNQFSLDERDGYIRIATTLNEANRITVLDKKLKEAAKIDGIAPGETIQSVRYIGNYGYVVTFRQTDPLFVIDFTYMTKPKIVGELKIPGFSSYLHPFNGYLVGIGTDGDENGTTDALKISLFDISDPTKPQEIDRFIIRNAYAETNHKTVMDCSHRDILGFIYTEYEPTLGYHDTKLCTLKIKDGRIEPIGSYSNAYDKEETQAPEYSPDGKTTFSYNKESYSNGAIKRATYIGDTLYTVSASRICSYPLYGGKMIEMLEF